jgi:hypothetical protein
MTFTCIDIAPLKAFYEKPYRKTHKGKECNMMLGHVTFQEDTPLNLAIRHE